jgi:hypothetical protein
LLNQNVLKLTEIRFFKCYFNDLLAPIILFSFSNFLLSFYEKEIYGKNIYIIITICGIFWEVITPMYKKESVCDIFDFIMYILGASIYLIIIRGWKKWKKIN